MNKVLTILTPDNYKDYLSRMQLVREDETKKYYELAVLVKSGGNFTLHTLRVEIPAEEKEETARELMTEDLHKTVNKHSHVYVEVNE